ncbi:MAG: ABC transporter permease [Thermodesulfobacteriota bacterium]|nr:MAG: ABC transporter permease [Thermodesulfobacteriota bacterium]
MHKKIQRIYALLERDLRKFIRNPLVVVVSIVMPILYLVILGSSFQGELKRLSLAVVDLDGGPYAERVVRRIRAIEAGRKSIKVYTLRDQATAIKALHDGVFKGVLIIPGDFSKKVIRGSDPTVGLFLDNAESISANTLEGAVAGALSDIKTAFIPVRSERQGLFLRAVNIYRKIDYDQSLIPGVVIMAIFLGAMTTGVFNVVMDRFLGIEESYFLTPLTKADIVLGLVLSGLIVTMVLAVTVLFFGSLAAGIYLWRIISLKGFFWVLVVFVLSALSLQGLMFMILGRANHPRIVGILGGFLNVIFFFPSGAVYPVESFPGWLQAFARVNPETYSIHALRALLFKGAGLGAIQGDLVFLAVFAFISVAIGTASFKRTL